MLSLIDVCIVLLFLSPAVVMLTAIVLDVVREITKEGRSHV